MRNVWKYLLLSVATPGDAVRTPAGCPRLSPNIYMFPPGGGAGSPKGEGGGEEGWEAQPAKTLTRVRSITLHLDRKRNE